MTRGKTKQVVSTQMQRTGLRYPLTVENGNLATSSGVTAKGEEVRSVVETRFYERVMRADYGVSDHTLEILDPHLITSEFQTSISTNVRDISPLSVKGDWRKGDDGIFDVYVFYSGNNSLKFSLAS
jgi:hypothetical protein